MADTKLSDLTAVTVLVGTDELYVNDGGVSKKITYTNFLAIPSGVTLDTSSGTLTLSAAQRDNIRGINLLRNGDFRVAQRGTTFDATTDPLNSDDQYLLDGWILLSDGNDRADVTQERSVVPTGTDSAIRFDVETVSGTSEKFGIVQIIEARDAAAIIGGTCSLSFKARTTSGNVENIRAHVISWKGTADTVTSDVVNAWGAEGTNPTFVTDWTVENTAANLVLTNTFQTFTIENISVDTTSAVNVAVFIHVDDTDLVAGDLLYITDVTLIPGATAGSFERMSIAQGLALAKRYLQRFDFPTGQTMIAIGQAVSTTQGRFPIPFQSEMRAIPTLGVSNVADFEVRDTSATVTATTGLTIVLGTVHTGVLQAVTSSLTDGESLSFTSDTTTDRWFQFISEL